VYTEKEQKRERITDTLKSKNKKLMVFICTGNYIRTVGKPFKPTASKKKFKTANAVEDSTTPKSNKYCHVSGVPRRILMGSGLDDWIYWHYYYNYNQL
jgi:hypothetical protein